MAEVSKKHLTKTHEKRPKEFENYYYGPYWLGMTQRVSANTNFFRRQKGEIKAKAEPLQYIKFIREVHERLQEHMITNNYVFKPPFNVGEFFVREYNKPASMAGRYVPHSYIPDRCYTFYWHKERIRSKNSMFYDYKQRLGAGKSKFLCGKKGLAKYIEQMFFDRTLPDYVGHKID